MTACDLVVMGGGLEAVATAEACARQGLSVRVLVSGDLGSGLDFPPPEPVDAQAALCMRRRRPRLLSAMQDLLHLAGPLVQKRPLLWLGQRAQPGWMDRSWRQAAEHRAAFASHLDATWSTLQAHELERFEPTLAPCSAGAMCTSTWTARWLPILVYTAQRACEYDTQFFFDSQILSCESVSEGYELHFRVPQQAEQSVQARCVVNAAGDQLGSVAEILGLDLPLHCSRRVFARLARRLTQSCIVLEPGLWLTPMDDETLVGPLPAPRENPLQPHRVSDTELQRWERWRSTAASWLADVPLAGWWVQRQPLLGRAASQVLEAPAPHLLDHVDHGRPGLWSTVPGLAVEHRWVAEKIADRVLTYLRHEAPRKRTAPLAPALGAASVARWSEQFDQNAQVIRGLYRRHGSRTHQVLQIADEQAGAAQVICHCRGITVAEIEVELQRPGRGRLVDVMRRCGLGQGSCNGTRCLLRVAQLWRELGQHSASELREELEAARQWVHEQRWPHFEGAAAVNLMLDQMRDDLFFASRSVEGGVDPEVDR